MEGSDDPVTMAALVPLATVAGAGVGIAGAMGAFDRGNGGGGGIGSAVAGTQAKTTAEPTLQLSEQARRNRRLAASALTRKFAEPTLGTPGLLGM